MARAAGIGKPTLYRYFPSKEELFLQVSNLMLRRLAQELRAIGRSGASPPEILRGMVRTLVDAVATSFVSLRMLSGEQPALAAHWRRLFRAHRGAILGAFAEALAAGAASGDFRRLDPEITPAMIVGMIRGASMVLPLVPRETLSDAAAALILVGVAKRTARSKCKRGAD